ncbi:MAG: 2TM domain-containing protein [Bacteroidia bacterium]
MEKIDNRDEQLWRIAKKRAGFKKQLASYIIVNGFLWAMWYFTEDHGGFEIRGGNFPWPIWPTLGWGIGLAFSYYGAYHDDKETDTMKEYQKLKDREGK